MKTKKVLTLLIVSLLVFAIVACTSQTPTDSQTQTPSEDTPSKEDTSSEKLPKPYTVKYMTGGAGRQADSDEVLELFNEKLQEYLPNTFLDLEVIPFGEYGEKWQLAAAAGEQIDIAWLGWMQSLQNEVNNGSYMQLDDAIDQYAPALWDEFDDWLWDCGRVGGKLYALPIGMGWSKVPWAFYFPTELADKYLDLEGFKKAQVEWEKSGNILPTEDFLDVVEDFLDKAKAGGDLNLGISPNAIKGLINNTWYSVPSNQNAVLPSAFCRTEDESSKAYSILDEDLSYFFERMAKWYKEGYIRKDALTVTDEKPDQISNGSYQGKIIIEGGGFEDLSQMNAERKWGMAATILPLTSYNKTPVGKHGTAAAIPSTCGNIERTMQLVELLWSEKGADLVTLLAYGIEGVHYEKGEGNMITTFEYSGVGGGTIDNKYGIPDWTIAYGRYCAKNQGYHPTMVEDRIKADAAARRLPLTGFGFDTEPVKLEQSQYDAIASEYGLGLFYGTYADPIATYKEMNKRLEAAGVGNIAVELQKQIDEFKAIK